MLLSDYVYRKGGEFPRNGELLKNPFRRTATPADSGGKGLFEILKKPHVFLVFSTQRVRVPEAETAAMRMF